MLPVSYSRNERARNAESCGVTASSSPLRSALEVRKQSTLCYNKSSPVSTSLSSGDPYIVAQMFASVRPEIKSQIQALYADARKKSCGTKDAVKVCSVHVLPMI